MVFFSPANISSTQKHAAAVTRSQCHPSQPHGRLSPTPWCPCPHKLQPHQMVPPSPAGDGATVPVPGGCPALLAATAIVPVPMPHPAPPGASAIVSPGSRPAITETLLPCLCMVLLYCGVDGSRSGGQHHAPQAAPAPPGSGGPSTAVAFRLRLCLAEGSLAPKPATSRGEKLQFSITVPGGGDQGGHVGSPAARDGQEDKGRLRHGSRTGSGVFDLERFVHLLALTAEPLRGRGGYRMPVAPPPNCHPPLQTVTPLWGLPTQDVPQGRAPGSYGLLWGGPHPGWVLPKGGDGGDGTGHPASYSAHRIQHLEGGAPMERYTQWDTGTPGDRVPPQRQQLWVGPPWDASPPG